MTRKPFRFTLMAVLMLVLSVGGVQAQGPVGTAFTYQGRLNQAGAPANDFFDFEFRLFDAPTGGSQVGSTITSVDVEVADGVFTVELDFGSNAFTGNARYLEMRVKGPGEAAFTVLEPRQALNAVPYALHALSGAGGGNGNAWSLAGNNIAAGDFLGTTNGVALDFRVNNERALRIEPASGPGLGFSPNLIGGLSENHTVPEEPDEVVVGATISGGGGVGEPNLIIDSFGVVGGGVNNRAGLYATVGGGRNNTASSDTSTIGGGNNNTANGTSTAVGGGENNTASGLAATVSGGFLNTAGQLYATVSGGFNNQVYDQQGTVGGGFDNQAGTDNSDSTDGASATIGGGGQNKARGKFTTIGGGESNEAFGDHATVGGGFENIAEEQYATVGGGHLNAASNLGVTVSGGALNTAVNGSSTVGGGFSNTAGGGSSTVGGGSLNIASGASSTVGGGDRNSVTGDYGTIAGGGPSDNSDREGTNNRVLGDYGAIGGGGGNRAYFYGTVGGGKNNSVTGDYGTIAGGGPSDVNDPTKNNRVLDDYGTIGGGGGNQANEYGTVGGGQNNRAGELNPFTDTRYATVGGGAGNIASNYGSTVVGGVNNVSSGIYSAVCGGLSNTAAGYESLVCGGAANVASGEGAAVVGGAGNVAAGKYSFAVGYQATAKHDGAFVWGDASEGEEVVSTAENQFVARASGGVWLYADGDATTGVSLPAGSGSWITHSDRNAKANFVQVDAGDLLRKLAEIPVQTWNYKTQDPSIRHIGPTAQDFYAAFGVGEDDKHISTVDADGVALAAIQGLYKLVQEKEARIAALERQNAGLEARLAGLEKMVEALSKE